MTHRQLQPGEKVRIIIEGAAVFATVTNHLDDYVRYRFFSDGYEHSDRREIVYASGEEQRLIKQLMEIRASARRSIENVRRQITQGAVT